MLKQLVIAIAIAGASTTAIAHDPTGRPEVGTNFAPHVTGTNGAGNIEIHRPAATSHDNASAGTPTMRGGADEVVIDRAGEGRGNLGSSQGSRIIGNDGGGPIVTHGNRQGPR